MKKLIAILSTILIMSGMISAQSILDGMDKMIEIRWNTNGVVYNGLLSFYNNGSGVFAVTYYLYPYGEIRVLQQAEMNFQYDAYGNCTTYIYCRNPQSNPPLAYSADNFVIYPNGAMYTQDTSGRWSYAITANIIPRPSWRGKLREYGISK